MRTRRRACPLRNVRMLGRKRRRALVRVRAGVLIALLGACALLVGACGASRSRPAPTASPTATATPVLTRVIEFEAPGASGTPEDGRCFSASLALPRADAWRCSAGNRILDPCFGPASASLLICVRDPWGTAAPTVLRLTEPLTPGGPLGSAHPWALETVDGARCTFLTGATSGVNGHRVAYGCIGGAYLLDDVQEGPLWTATQVTLGPGSAGQPPAATSSATVGIATAWR